MVLSIKMDSIYRIAYACASVVGVDNIPYYGNTRVCA